MEPKTCQKGPKVGSEYWPTFKTSHCVRTACMAFPLQGTREISQNHGSGLCSATIVPQDGVVVDVTRSSIAIRVVRSCNANCSASQDQTHTRNTQAGHMQQRRVVRAHYNLGSAKSSLSTHTHTRHTHQLALGLSPCNFPDQCSTPGATNMALLTNALCCTPPCPSPPQGRRSPTPTWGTVTK